MYVTEIVMLLILWNPRPPMLMDIIRSLRLKAENLLVLIRMVLI